MRHKTSKVEFVRARPGSLPSAIVGSRRVMCAKCKRHKVWLTPNIEEIEAKPVCNQCAPRQQIPGGGR